MDFLLVSTENDDEAYFASARDLTDAILQRAIDQLEQNRAFQYLPSASLTAMLPPSVSQSGTTVGTLTVFRGGRTQWSENGIGSLAQDWRVPHLYVDAAEGLRLWQALRSGDLRAVTGQPWVLGQTRLCPICGFDLSHLSWQAVGTAQEAENTGVPPFEVPPYQTCGGCRTTFGIDWIGATYGEMREFWLAQACPSWASGEVPEHVGSDPAAMKAFQVCRRDLMRTPTDHPLSCASAAE